MYILFLSCCYSVSFQNLKCEVLSFKSKMEKPTTSAIRQIVADLRQPLLAISVAVNGAVNGLDKLDAALVAFESQELAKAVSRLPTPTSLSDSSSDESSGSSDSESVTSAASKISLAAPTAEEKEGSSSPTLPTNDGQMIDLSLGVIDPEPPTSPMLPSLPLSGLGRAPPTSPTLSLGVIDQAPPTSPTLSDVSSAGLDRSPPTSPTMSDVPSAGLDRSPPTSPTSAKSFVWRTSPVGSPFTITETLPRIYWRPALPSPPEAPPIDLSAPLSLPTLSASPTKSATPKQGTPSSPLTEPLQRRPKLICSIPLNVRAPESASAPATTRSQPDTANSQTISLPHGWEKRFVARTKGQNKGRLDVYLRPPNGNQLRSMSELLKYLQKHPEVQHDAAVTNFNKYDVPESDDGADSSLSGDDNADLIESGDQEGPEHSPSPPRGRMPARSISRSIPNTSSTDIYEESTF